MSIGSDPDQRVFCVFWDPVSMTYPHPGEGGGERKDFFPMFDMIQGR